MTSGWLQRMAACGAAAVVLVAPASPAEIRVTPVVANGRVAVSFSLPTALGPDVRELVESGLLMTLAFTVDLKAPSALWFDRTIAHVDLSSSVKYDNLTGVHHVSRMRDGHVTWSERTSRYADAQAWLTTFERVVIAEDSQLQPNAEYDIQVRMRSRPRRTFPLWPWSSDDAGGRATFTFIR